jgi:hypothetical protein
LSIGTQINLPGGPIFDFAFTETPSIQNEQISVSLNASFFGSQAQAVMDAEFPFSHQI